MFQWCRACGVFTASNRYVTPGGDIGMYNRVAHVYDRVLYRWLAA